MAAIVDGTEIILSGTVGYLFWEDGFDHADVILALAQVGRDRDVTIRINSGGGIASEGAAIHAAIRGHRGRKTIIVEGVAASAASVIAMAGDEIEMALGAIMMIHDPSGLTLGTVADHEATIRGLDTLAESMAGIYASRTGRPAEECRAEMRAETWMTPEQAVAKGYADRVARASNDNNQPVEPTAFDYRLFKNPPERFVALASQNGWSKRSAAKAASAASTCQSEETSMATQNKADGAPAEKTEAQNIDVESIRRESATAALAESKARIKAILDTEEAQGREDQARYFAFETEMTAEQAVAALAKAPKAQPAQSPAGPNRFEAAMTRAGNPQVGADSAAPVGEADEAAAEASKIVAIYRGKAA